jgi:hypothetical protein
MRALVLLLPLLLVVAPATLAQPPEGAAHSTVEPSHGPFVRLTTGEVIQGDVVLGEAARGVPQFITVNGVAYPNFRIHSFRTDERVYGLTHIHAGRPMMLVRHQNGNVQIYGEVNRAEGTAQFFHVGASPMLPLTGSNLRRAFEGHPEAMRSLAQERVYSALGTGAFVIGAGLVLAGAAVQFGEVEGPYPSGVIIAGTGIGIAALVNAIIPGARQSARNAAIRAYNQ